MIRGQESCNLARLLSDIAGYLSAIGEGREFERREPIYDQWEGNGFVYLEVDLGEHSTLEADLSVHEGKVFIRVEAA